MCVDIRADSAASKQKKNVSQTHDKSHRDLSSTAMMMIIIFGRRAEKSPIHRRILAAFVFAFHLFALSCFSRWVEQRPIDAITIKGIEVTYLPRWDLPTLHSLSASLIRRIFGWIRSSSRSVRDTANTHLTCSLVELLSLIIAHIRNIYHSWPHSPELLSAATRYEKLTPREQRQHTQKNA